MKTRTVPFKSLVITLGLLFAGVLALFFTLLGGGMGGHGMGGYYGGMGGGGFGGGGASGRW